ncbi:MAG: hypothetical protein A3D52_01900 [Candidatus Taylorbacteria bacterium RIFCSPHIGHO2_02_FULL_44_36]|nr:MAG: hypothetical protein A3D52_01900 [Candidatus Taylorbacteria bacterium RIFCSPHIGHO2_02_FULL_44_36]
MFFDKSTARARFQIFFKFKRPVFLSNCEIKIKFYWQTLSCCWYISTLMPFQSVFKVIGATNIITIFAF